MGRVCQHSQSAESREFSPGSPVSSHKGSCQGGLGLIVSKIMTKTVNIDNVV